MDISIGPTKPPVHYWIVTILAVLWNGFGAYDYVMSLTAGDPYLRSMGMTDPQIAYYHAMPSWMMGVWTLGVWGAVIGTLLLIARSRWAVHAFAASLVGAVLSLLYSQVLSPDGREVMGGQATIISVVITAIGVFLLWYAWLMAKRRVLR